MNVEVETALLKLKGVIASASTEASPGLGSERCGQGLALLALARFEQDEALANVATSLIATTWAATDAQGSSQVSLFGGLSGAGWLACRVLDYDPRDATAHRVLCRAIDKVVHTVGKSPWLGHFDHISGLAGIATFAAEPRALAVAPVLADLLVERLLDHASHTPFGLAWAVPLATPEDEGSTQAKARDVVNLGLAHGSPGVVLALARLLPHMTSKPLRRAATRALQLGVKFLAHQRGSCKGDDLVSCFPTMTSKQHVWTNPSRLAWCYGDLGVAYAILYASACLGEDLDSHSELAKVLAECNTRPFEQSGIYDASLCHGLSSVIAMSLAIKNLWPDAPVSSLLARSTGQLLNFIQTNLSSRGLPAFGSGRRRVYSYDLLQGPPGSLLALLALTDSSHLPNLSFLGIEGRGLPREPATTAPAPKLAAVRDDAFLGIRVCLFSPRRMLCDAASPTSSDGHNRYILSHPDVRRALWIARPRFLQNVSLKDQATRAYDKRERSALSQYFRRMCLRATPFGGFSAIGLLTPTADAVSPVRMPPVRTVAKADSGLLTKIAYKTLSDEPTELRINPSTWIDGGRINWISADDRTNPDSHERMSAEVNTAISDIVESQATGTEDHYIEQFVQRGIDPVTARQLTQSMIRHGIIVPLFDPILMGPNTTSRTLERLATSTTDVERATRIDGLKLALERFNDYPHDELLQQASSLAIELAGREWNGDTLHVDSHLASAMHVPLDVQRVLEVGWRTVLRVGKRATQPSRFVEFEHEFIERYGDRAVLLAAAVDQEHGIGYDAQRRSLAYAWDDFSGRHDSVQKALASFPIKDAPTTVEEWVLSEREATRLFTSRGTQGAPLPGVMLARVGCSRVGGRPRWRVYPEGIFPGNPATLFGRFSTENPALVARLRAHINANETIDGPVVVADVLCASESRSSNILQRASFTPLVIEILGDSGLPSSRRIPLRDLWLRHDGARFRVLSRSRGLELIPTLHAAHFAPPFAPPAYRFLIDLITYGLSRPVAWSWDDLESAAYLPRVRFRNVVLAGRQWVLKLPVDAREGSRTFAWIDDARRRLNLPRFVSPRDQESDRVTPFDLDDRTSVERLVGALRRNHNGVQLGEYLPAPNDWWIEGNDGPRASEVVYAPRVQESSENDTFLPSAWRMTVPTARTQPQWLYVRLRGASPCLESLLLDVSSLIGRFIGAGLVSRWFFVKYTDPGPELRIRALAASEDALSVHPVLLQQVRALASQRSIESLSIEEYVAEIARYGGDASIDECEKMFSADSNAAIVLLRRKLPISERWLLGVCSVAAMLEDIELPLPLRLRVIRHAADLYGGGTENNSWARRALAGRWRECYAVLEKSGGLRAKGVRPEPWEQRAIAWEESFARLLRMEQDRVLVTPLHDVLASLCHMTINRLLFWRTSREEALVYEALRRIYNAQCARERQEILRPSA